MVYYRYRAHGNNQTTTEWISIIKVHDLNESERIEHPGNLHQIEFY